VRPVWRQASTGQVVIRRPVSRRVAGCRTQPLHELTGADKVDTDAGRSHWTLDADTALDIGRADTRRADAGHVPDAGHWTGGRWTCGRGQGHQGTVGIRISWYYDTVGTATRIAVAGTRGARQPWRLDGEVPAGARLLAVPPRAAKRQAAPFSRGEPKPTPRPPGAGPARPTVGTRTASRPSASAGRRRRAARMLPRLRRRADPGAGRDPACRGSVRAAPADYPVRGSRRPLPLVRPAVHPRHQTQTSDALGAAGAQLGPRALALAACFPRGWACRRERPHGCLISSALASRLAGRPSGRQSRRCLTEVGPLGRPSLGPTHASRGTSRLGTRAGAPPPSSSAGLRVPKPHCFVIAAAGEHFH
jgi:hypothetical protein